MSGFKSNPSAGYYAMRSHSSHFCNTELWKVLSRPMRTEQEARDWVSFEKSMEKNKRHNFFVIQVTEGEGQ